MTQTMEKQPAGERRGRGIIYSLAADLDAHAPELRRAWMAEIQRRRLLRHLPPTNSVARRSCVLRIWTDFFHHSRSHHALAQVRWVAERSDRGPERGRDAESFLAARDVAATICCAAMPTRGAG